MRWADGFATRYTSRMHCTSFVARPLALIMLASAILCGCQATKHQRAPILVDSARAELIAGNERFLAGGMDVHESQHERVAETGKSGQHPPVGVLTCADSRTPPELTFDQGIGDLFVVRVAGNYVDAGAVGTFEYGAVSLGMHTIVVMGHTKCGAVTATCSGHEYPGSMSSITNAIRPAVVGLTDVTEASTANVRWQMKQLSERSEILRSAQAAGTLQIIGAMYNVETGRVQFLD